MWICLNDAFLSIVKKDCRDDELLVRARRRGDIEKIFPRVTVEEGTMGDYQFRARVHVRRVMGAIASEVGGIKYGNFKDSVKDKRLANAYIRFWHDMFMLQENLSARKFRAKSATNSSMNIEKF